MSVAIESGQAETRARFAAYEESLADPSDQTRQWFDAVNPDCEALVYAGSFTAVRTPEQMAAERKDIQREFLERSSQLVTLDAGLSSLIGPAVVQGIPSHGVAMATSHTYLVPRLAPEDRLAVIAAELRRDCTSAVIGAFDVGTPCTFYGFVKTNGVYDFGPVEALVYWDRQTWRIHAPGIVRPLIMTADSLASARAEVRNAVLRLHQKTAYLGAFGVDGVIADSRYVIHEVNPRICAGFSLLDWLAPAVAPLAAVDLVLREQGPAASMMLTDPLAELAFALSTDHTSAFRLWEKGGLVPSESRDHATWARQIRREVSQPNLIPIAELEELAA